MKNADPFGTKHGLFLKSFYNCIKVTTIVTIVSDRKEVLEKPYPG